MKINLVLLKYLVMGKNIAKVLEENRNNKWQKRIMFKELSKQKYDLSVLMINLIDIYLYA